MLVKKFFRKGLGHRCFLENSVELCWCITAFFRVSFENLIQRIVFPVIRSCCPVILCWGQNSYKLTGTHQYGPNLRGIEFGEEDSALVIQLSLLQLQIFLQVVILIVSKIYVGITFLKKPITCSWECLWKSAVFPPIRSGNPEMLWKLIVQSSRSSHPEVFLGKDVLIICRKFYRRIPMPKCDFSIGTVMCSTKK